MVKVIVIYGHPTDPEAFEKYYSETHLPIAAQIPGIAKVELTKVLGTPDGAQATDYRMAEVYFNSMEELQAGMGSAEGQATVSDLSNFATGGVNVMIGEVAD